MFRRITSSYVLCLSLALASTVRADELLIAFTLDTPPYVNDQAKSGISVDIVREALKRKGHTFRVEQMPYGELADAVAKRGVDAAATVIKADDGTYYSENYITFKNAAITKQTSGIQLNAIADLKGRSIVAWQNAYQDLGPEFQALFSPEPVSKPSGTVPILRGRPRPSDEVAEQNGTVPLSETVLKPAPMNNAPYRQKYREIANQRQQVAMFWKGEAEVLVIDESVMKWFTKELANDVDTSAPLVYSHIFPAQTQFRISFKNQQVRDDFDAGFQEIRASGLVEEIYDRYLK